MQFLQNYNPLGSPVLSTLVAAIPIVTLLYLLAFHPRTDKHGNKHRGIEPPPAALISGFMAILIAVFILKMPLPAASMAFVNGVLYGLFPIGWIVVAAMFLYTITLVTGKFETVKDSVSNLSADRRIQAILIAFSFGAFIEGAAGFGTPVAIAGALMVGLGFKPFTAAVLCLIANTAPVAYGAIGTPLITLAKVTGLPEFALSAMAGRQLPFFSLIIPIWTIATMVYMDKKSMKTVVKDTMEVMPALLVAGISFALTQFYVSNYIGPMLVDILGGIVSMLAVIFFLKVWQPKTTYRLVGEAPAKVGSKHSTKEVVIAWIPWSFLTAFVFLWGLPQVKGLLNMFYNYPINVPFLHNVVVKTAPVVPKNSPEAAVYSLNLLSAAGTGIFIAAILTGLFLRLTAAQWKEAALRTAKRMKTPLLTIGLVMGMGFTTKFAGLDAILGLAFTKTGILYPFFAAMLGWLGVFLTGSDTSSNVLFGNMQKITAEQLGLDPILIAASNSTGGVMGKMIDAQSIVVATAACYENRQEGSLAVGPIFRTVFWHSIILAALVGVLIMLQAYVFQWMIPPATWGGGAAKAIVAYKLSGVQLLAVLAGLLGGSYILGMMLDTTGKKNITRNM
ncbi:L-lactate permease [Desulfosporosinus sp. HMP52]|uniref:L-lactate permease n=1 Tax=Desulfosporosinus sp. HMP52 TaxID=1487923 RepID=UPI000B1323CF|nr:L-lactate permease [Desulfosporosinus sp. HMP52]